MHALKLSFLWVAFTTTSLYGNNADEIRQAVQRSIPFIESNGLQWIEEKKCVSCHQVNSMAWSLSAAERHGFEVNERIDAWIDWTAKASLKKNDQGNLVGLGNKEGVAQIIYGLNQSAYPLEEKRQLAALLLKDQQEDGSWKAGGQLPTQKRSKRETDIVSTMWITLALIPYSEEAGFSQAIQRSTELIHNAKAGRSVEWYSVRLLVALSQNDRTAMEKWSSELLTLQNDDGGWGWLLEDPSDALGTGMAIYALSSIGKNPNTPTLQRGQNYLLKTQQANGSWNVKGTKFKKKDRVEETSIYWGTTWASLALISCLPE